jgi:hypothetical protein
MHPTFPPFSTKCVKRVKATRPKTVVSQMYPSGISSMIEKQHQFQMKKKIYDVSVETG